jgi:hypothetical protein
MALLLAACLAASPVWSASGNTVIDGIERQVRESRKQKPEPVRMTGFFYICAYGSKADVEKALAAGADPKAGDPAHNGISPLAVAASYNPDPGVITALLAAGADVNQPLKPDNRTPLHLALMTNPVALPVVQALLAANPNIYAQDRFFYIPLDFAISGNYRNGAFDADPREDLILLLLEASERLPYTMKNISRKSLMTRKMKQYDINLGYGRRDKDVMNAFRRLGADERALQKDGNKAPSTYRSLNESIDTM